MALNLSGEQEQNSINNDSKLEKDYFQENEQLQESVSPI